MAVPLNIGIHDRFGGWKGDSLSSRGAFFATLRDRLVGSGK